MPWRARAITHTLAKSAATRAPSLSAAINAT
jgi:hypothetical protein